MIFAVGGFQHETNTFSPQPGDWRTFYEADSWPALTVGPPLVAGLPSDNQYLVKDHVKNAELGATKKPYPLTANIPLAGFISAVAAADKGSGCKLAPLAWSSACPCGTVTADAFDRMCSLLCDQLTQVVAETQIHGVYLDLHGAMVSEQFDDGEGELLRRVRAVVGPDLPVVVSLDLHANVSHAMVARADATLAYRTYPHIDMAETGKRSFHILHRLATAAATQQQQQQKQQPDATNCRQRLCVALRKPPFLIPITSMVSAFEPNASLYKLLQEVETDVTGGDPSLICTASFTPGFGLADCRDAGPAVFVYGPDQQSVDRAADKLEAAVMAAESQFLGSLLIPDQAVAAAVDQSLETKQPVVLADAQDNPGCGATGDTVGLLQAMLDYRRQKKNTAAAAAAADPIHLSLGLICDGPAAVAAHAAGVGAQLQGVPVGAASGWGAQKPVDCGWTVIALSDGDVAATGPFYGGSTLSLGPCALLEHKTDSALVSVCVSSKKCQAADMEMFEHLGLRLRQQQVVGVKSAVHFRAHFDQITNEIWVVAAPGAAPCDHANLVYNRLRKGVKKMPFHKI